MPVSLTLHLTGPLRLVGPDGPVAGLSRRGQAMLAYLSCQPGMRAERGALADLLWSDRAEDQARASLRQELSVLRRALPDGLLGVDRQAVWLDRAQIALPEGDGDFLQGFDLASEGFEDWLRSERARRADRPAAAARPAVAGQRPSLAVLAFADLSDGAADMFADGVVEEVTGALSRVDEFDVIARQSAYALRGEVLDVPAAAARLGADYIVEGTVRRAGARVRISVQLVRGADGHTLWTERFDDRLDDLFDLQDRIAGQVAGQMSPSLRHAEIARAGSLAPADRTAYELTLTALPHFWAHRGAENEKAIALLDAALACDPANAAALAYKAWALAQKSSYMWSDDPPKDRATAAGLADAALAAETVGHPPTLVATAAALTLSTERLALSQSLIDRAVALDPNNAWGWMRRGWNHMYLGAQGDALACFDRAEALSPLDPFLFNIHLGRAAAHRQLGDFDRSIELIRRGMRANPGITWAHRMLVGDLTLAGRTDEAAEAAADFLAHYPHVTIRYLQSAWPPMVRRAQPAYFDAFRSVGIPEG